jgi:hypothetical protein
MELKKGYTREELNLFMQQAFREKRRVRRTPSGGWTACGQACTDVPKSPEIPEIPAVPEAPEAPEAARPAPPKGFRQRLRDLFGRAGSRV